MLVTLPKGKASPQQENPFLLKQNSFQIGSNEGTGTLVEKQSESRLERFIRQTPDIKHNRKLGIVSRKQVAKDNTGGPPQKLTQVTLLSNKQICRVSYST